MNIYFLSAGLFALLLLYVVRIYNKGITLKNYIKEAFSTMDIYMKKRWDLIPNLTETVKGYAEHEKSTFDEVINLRNKNYTGLSDEEKMNLNQKLSFGLSKLVAVAENYPELKANETFLKLQDELSKIEEDIANSRKYYNGCSREFNTFIQKFPANIFASLFNFREQKMYEIDEAQRQNAKVQF